MSALYITSGLSSTETAPLAMKGYEENDHDISVSDFGWLLLHGLGALVCAAVFVAFVILALMTDFSGWWVILPVTPPLLTVAFYRVRNWWHKKKERDKKRPWNHLGWGDVLWLVAMSFFAQFFFREPGKKTPSRTLGERMWPTRDDY